VPSKLQSAAFWEPLLLHILHNENILFLSCRTWWTVNTLTPTAPFSADLWPVCRCVVYMDRSKVLLHFEGCSTASNCIAYALTGWISRVIHLMYHVYSLRLACSRHGQHSDATLLSTVWTAINLDTTNVLRNVLLSFSRILSHWDHFTVCRFISVYLCVFCVCVYSCIFQFLKFHYE